MIIKRLIDVGEGQVIITGSRAGRK